MNESIGTAIVVTYAIVLVLLLAHGVWAARVTGFLLASRLPWGLKATLFIAAALSPVVGFYTWYLAAPVIHALRSRRSRDLFTSTDSIHPEPGTAPRRGWITPIVVVAAVLASGLILDPTIRSDYAAGLVGLAAKTLLGKIVVFYVIHAIVFFIARSIGRVTRRGFFTSPLNYLSLALILALAASRRIGELQRLGLM